MLVEIPDNTQETLDESLWRGNNIFFSEDDIHINMSKWESGKCSHLFRSSLNEGIEYGSYDENISYIKKHVRTPKDLNNILNKFRYGFYDGAKDHTGNDIDFDKYRTMEPRDFIKYAIGTCWDYTEAEAFLFDEVIGEYKITNKRLKNGTYSLYYMQHQDKDNDMPSHTWLAYMDNDKVYLFESSWKSHRGIKHFNSEEEMLDYYDQEQRKYYESTKNHLTNAVFIKYMPLRRYNLTPTQFMTAIYKSNTSRVIRNEFKDIVKKYHMKYMTEETDMLNESVIEFKPLMKPKETQFIKFSSDKDKYVGMFEAREAEFMKKVKFISHPAIRDGKPQPAYVDDNGDLYRVRAEMIVVDDNGLILVDPEKCRGGMHYSFPGGGIDDPSEGILKSAIRETNEEFLVDVIPDESIYTGIAWKYIYPSSYVYKGAISFVCVGKYKGAYKKYVKVEDRTPSAAKRKTWVDPNKFKLKEPHIKALQTYYKKKRLSEALIPEVDYTFLDMDITPLTEDWKSKKNNATIADMNDVVANCKDIIDLFDLVCANTPLFLSAVKISDEKILLRNKKSPNEVIRDNIANCMEISMFVQQFCELKQIKYELVLVDLIYFTKERFSHIFPLVYQYRTWYWFNYCADIRSYSIENLGSSLSQAIDSSTIKYRENVEAFRKLPPNIFTPFSVALGDRDKYRLYNFAISNEKIRLMAINGSLEANAYLNDKEKEWIKSQATRSLLQGDIELGERTFGFSGKKLKDTFVDMRRVIKMLNKH